MVVAGARDLGQQVLQARGWGGALGPVGSPVECRRRQAGAAAPSPAGIHRPRYMPACTLGSRLSGAAEKQEQSMRTHLRSRRCGWPLTSRYMSMMEVLMLTRAQGASTWQGGHPRKWPTAASECGWHTAGTGP